MPTSDLGAQPNASVTPAAPPMHERAAGCSRRAHGFTLIEMVVVMLLLTIIFGMMGVMLTRNEDDLVHEEASRLALVLQNAQEQAILEGRPYAFALTDSGYRFLAVDVNGRLRPIQTDEILAPHRVPYPIALAPLHSRDSDPKQRDLLLFDPSGEFAPFVMVFKIGEFIWYVQGRTDGDIRATKTLESAAT